LAAFTVEQGSPLPPRAGGSAQALPSAALESVRQVERDGVEPSPPASPGVQGSVRTREERQRDYDERFIWSHETAVVDLGTGAVVNRWTNFFQGREGVSLDGESLYIALKRYDLAATYHSRSNAKTWLIVGGVLGAIGGYGVFTAGLFVPGPCTTMDSLTNTCVTNQFGNAPLLIAGGIVGTVGLGVMIAGLFVNPNPIDAAAAHRLVDEFNGKLKSDLGLGSSADRASDPPAVSWNVDAFSTRGGGGLTLRLNL
jgi:hypothetical protein